MWSAAATFAAMFIHYFYDCIVSEDCVESFLSVETTHEII